MGGTNTTMVTALLYVVGMYSMERFVREGKEGMNRRTELSSCHCVYVWVTPLGSEMKPTRI